mmetsp:Transcript_10968/g.38593  ORF Transcript_10968/g.38593 Transcript_10968/m.38593 type:complete len:204 (+) Transcript_10968:374-985(+)
MTSLLRPWRPPWCAPSPCRLPGSTAPWAVALPQTSSSTASSMACSDSSSAKSGCGSPRMLLRKRACNAWKTLSRPIGLLRPPDRSPPAPRTASAPRLARLPCQHRRAWSSPPTSAWIGPRGPRARPSTAPPPPGASGASPRPRGCSHGPRGLWPRSRRGTARTSEPSPTLPTSCWPPTAWRPPSALPLKATARSQCTCSAPGA